MKTCPLCGSNTEGTPDHRCSIKEESGWVQIDPREYLRRIIVEAEKRGQIDGIRMSANYVGDNQKLSPADLAANMHKHADHLMEESR